MAVHAVVAVLVSGVPQLGQMTAGLHLVLAAVAAHVSAYHSVM